VQPSDYIKIRNDIQLSILNYYKYMGREAKYFRESENVEWEGWYLHFLVEKKRVIRYGFGFDRGVWVGGIEIGLGPEYLGPAYFWSYEKSTNFVSSVDAESIFHNLRLLDEFWRTGP
jgi:hypothetical protein